MQPQFIPDPSATGARKVLQRGFVRLFMIVTGVLTAVLAGGLVSALLVRVFPSIKGSAGEPIVSLAVDLVQVVMVVAAYWLLVRLFEHRPAAELGRHRFGRELWVGLLIGATLFSLTALGLLSVGAYRFERGALSAGILSGLGLALAAGFFEEILIRGAIFRILEEYLGSWGALGASALLFGALHLSNPNATVPAALAIALEAGVLLGAAYMFTRRLWLAIGLHAAWNFTQSAIFGISTSGLDAGPSLLKGTPVGSTLISGGAFGAEASIVAVVVCLSAGVTLAMLARRRGHVIAPIWRRTAEPPGHDVALAPDGSVAR